MANFIVSYQLNKEKDYQKLWDEFSRLNGQKAMRSVYLVECDATAKELNDHLIQFIDNNDYLFVSEINKRPYKHKCLKGTQDWIDQRF